MAKEEIKAIERLEAMENNFGVRLEGIYSEFEKIDSDNCFIYVRGEIVAINGTNIKTDIDLKMSAYNAEGKVIATESCYFSSDDFYGVSPFSFCSNVIMKPIKIKVYPVKG